MKLTLAFSYHLGATQKRRIKSENNSNKTSLFLLKNRQTAGNMEFGIMSADRLSQINCGNAILLLSRAGRIKPN
jgi:hypothetical protein